MAEPPADVPEPVRSQLLALAEDVAEALCDRAASCCSASDTVLDRVCVDHAALVWLNISQMREEVPGGVTLQYDFDESRAAACRARLQQLSAGCGLDVRGADPSKLAPLAEVQAFCSAPLSVFAPGYPAPQCFGSLDCVAYGDGLTCAHGTCQARGRVGDACRGTGSGVGAPCQDGLHCDSGSCEVDLELGADCSGNRSTYCRLGLACRQGVCATPPGVGRPCEQILDCATGLRCVPSSPDAPIGAGICMAPDANWHQPCTQDWQCENVCVNGFCNPRDDHFCVSPY